MAEIPNVRRLSDVLIHLRLKDNGVAVDFTSLSDIRTLAYSDSQKAVAGPCPCEIDEDDRTILNVRYNVDVHQYLGIAKIVLRCTYLGRTKTYDVPVLNFVNTTAEATGVLVLPDPEISVELEVDDVSTSLLDDAINAAFAAADLANLRADEASSAAAGAAEAATLAREKAQAANSAAGRANSSATNANNAAAAAVAATESIQELETAIEEAEAAREQQAESDHTRAGSDHETAGSDHTRAESDHGTASDDHTQANSDHGRAQTDHDTAASDHSTASTDHTTAASDHTTAASDHSTAESDHTRAEEDHTIVQGYDTRLTNVEGEVSQLGQKVTDLNGYTTDESGVPSTASSFWVNNNGVIGYTSSGMGLHRADPIPIVKDEVILLTTTLGATSANAGFLCDDLGNILQSFAKDGATTTVSFTVPDGATKLYINYLTTFSLSNSGLLGTKQDKLVFDEVPTEGSDNPVKSKGIYPLEKIKNDIEGTSFDNSNTSSIPSSLWTNNNGVIATTSSSSMSRANAVTVKQGQIVDVFCGGLAPVEMDDWAYVCDDSGNILQTVPNTSIYATYTPITIPVGGTKLYLNFRNSFFAKIRNFFAQVDSNLAHKSVDGKFPLALSESDFVNYGINGVTGEITNGPNILISNFIEIAPGTIIYYSTLNSYRFGVVYYGQDKNYIKKNEWYTGASQVVAPQNAVFVRIEVASPSGVSTRPVWDDASLSVYLSKAYQTVLAASISDVYNALSEYFDFELPILSPSPQLPADGDTDSDFNAETMTSMDIQSAIESQIDRLSVPNVGVSPYTPKYGTIYETIGKDASGLYDIKAYVFTRRNRFAWRASAALYAWKSGNTTYYTDHRSPLVGDTVYSNNTRTDSGYTVTAYNSAGPSITVNGNTYTRDDAAKVDATDIFTQSVPSATTTSIAACNKSGASVGTATVSSPTQIVLGGKTYARLSSGDFHTENKATIVIWGNEHGPQSDPNEPSIIIYRLIKDLCECGGDGFIKFLRKYCKFVFIPAANPYGINKFVSDGREGRTNFNNVNINRNYDTVGWGEQTDSNKGSYAGDQPETQFIMNTALDVDADIAIDIHCLGYSSNPLNEGRTHYEGYVSALNGKVAEIMVGYCGHSYSSYGDADPSTKATGADWIYSLGLVGGLIEMNAGPYAVSYDGKQHKAEIMFTDYTLLLNVIRMWYYNFDPTLDLSRMSIK